MPEPLIDLHERTERTAQVLLAAARDVGYWVSPDLRVGVDDGAKLIGMAPRGFAKRLPETGIRVYRIGGRSHKRTIRIFDLAAWLEAQSGVGEQV